MRLINIYIKISQDNWPEKGFTLIELLVVVIIVGVLAAIATPNLITNIGKSRETEATVNLGTLSRSQQSYHYENQIFASTISDLTANVTLNSKHYNFPDPSTASGSLVKHQALPVSVSSSQVRNYATGVYFTSSSGEFSTVICRASSINAAVDAPNIPGDNCTNSGRKIQ